MRHSWKKKVEPILAKILNLGSAIGHSIDLALNVPGRDVTTAMHCLASLKILAGQKCR